MKNLDLDLDLELEDVDISGESPIWALVGVDTNGGERIICASNEKRFLTYRACVMLAKVNEDPYDWNKGFKTIRTFETLVEKEVFEQKN